MSSPRITLPTVSLADVRDSQAAGKMKSSVGEEKKKVEKTAKDFEAVLLSHWLDQAEKSFATVPGSNPDEDNDPGREQFSGLAMQSLGAAMSGGRGGLGIASMVIKHLESAKATAAISNETKHLDRGAVSGQVQERKK